MKRVRLALCIVFILLCGFFSAGCSKPAIGLIVASQPNVNPDHSARPSPVIVKMYELRNDLAFKQADFHSLFDTPLQVLGADLIAADELVFIPGEARQVLYHPNPNTRFVGVVAGFRQMDRALWRVIKAVDPEEETWLAMELNDASILVLPEEEAEDWDPEEAVRQFQQQAVKPQTPDEAGASVPASQAATTTQSGQSAASIPSAQNPPAVSSPAADAKMNAPAEQSAKEVITVIGQDGVETVQGVPPGGNGQSSPVLPGVSSPIPSSLPSMRSY